ncbi:hypothetical protein ACOTEQ_09455 [Achromobacter xylosoxidans]
MNALPAKLNRQLFTWIVVGLIMTIFTACEKKIAPPKSVTEVSQRLTGSWMFTEPVDPRLGKFPWEWIKWTIRSDGTMTECKAYPFDDNWRNCKDMKAEFVSDKYASTGQRWFGIKVDLVYGVYQAKSDTIEIQIPGFPGSGIMKRGDRNPFSK